jgi:hypothetical protein
VAQHVWYAAQGRSNLGNVMQKNVANTNIIYFGGKLLCLWEAAQPYRLEPTTLRTLRLETLNGTLQPGMPFTTGVPALDKLAAGVVGDPLTAHPKVDRARAGGEGGDRLVTYGYRAKASAAALAAGRGAFDSELMLYEFDEAWRVVARRPIELEGFAFVHDFVVTEHYVLWFQNPCDFDPTLYVLGEKNPAQLITYDETRPTLIHAVPRDAASGRAQRTLEIPACFVFHHARGFECGGTEGGGQSSERGEQLVVTPGDERLVVDSVVLEAFPAFDTLTRPPDDGEGAALKALDFGAVPINRLTRFEIDLGCKDPRAAVRQATPRPRAVSSRAWALCCRARRTTTCTARARRTPRSTTPSRASSACTWAPARRSRTSPARGCSPTSRSSCRAPRTGPRTTAGYWCSSSTPPPSAAGCTSTTRRGWTTGLWAWRGCEGASRTGSMVAGLRARRSGGLSMRGSR